MIRQQKVRNLAFGHDIFGVKSTFVASGLK